jgi:Plasmid pRiA4b ORF-3-like protein
MAILKFRIYFEEDESVYRDVAIRHTQSFFDLHETILKSYEFDNKHKATFFRSNDHWQRGREISLEKYDKEYKAPPLLMTETTIGSEIRDPNQKFIYLYDFNKNWSFLVELIHVSKEESPKLSYPATVRTEGIAPSQYGTKGLLGPKFADVEEKYDLTQGADGFGEVGEEEEEDHTLGADGGATEESPGEEEVI